MLAYYIEEEFDRHCTIAEESMCINCIGGSHTLWHYIAKMYTNCIDRRSGLYSRNFFVKRTTSCHAQLLYTDHQKCPLWQCEKFGLKTDLLSTRCGKIALKHISNQNKLIKWSFLTIKTTQDNYFGLVKLVDFLTVKSKVWLEDRAFEQITKVKQRRPI